VGCAGSARDRGWVQPPFPTRRGLQVRSRWTGTCRVHHSSSGSTARGPHRGPIHDGQRLDIAVTRDVGSAVLPDLDPYASRRALHRVHAHLLGRRREFLDSRWMDSWLGNAHRSLGVCPGQRDGCWTLRALSDGRQHVTGMDGACDGAGVRTDLAFRSAAARSAAGPVSEGVSSSRARTPSSSTMSRACPRRLGQIRAASRA